MIWAWMETSRAEIGSSQTMNVGSTARALVDTRSLEHIDVVDISREILALSDLAYPDPKQHPLRDPRVQVHVEDGRWFLQTTERRYDLITGEPPPPKNAGVVNLYTREYFELVRSRLAPGGIHSYWVPVHELTEDDTRSILRAYCDVFPDCTLWTGTSLDWMLIGSNDARFARDEAAFTAQWRDPVVRPELEAVALERPEQLGATFMADADQLRAWIGDAEPVTESITSREKILEVAEALFARRGFAGVGMREVADVVGLGKSSLFHHFKTKLHLYGEVIARVLGRIEERVRPALTIDAGPAEKLDRWLDALIDALAEQPATARLLLRSLVEDEDMPPEPTPEIESAERAIESILIGVDGLLRAGIEAGVFRAVSVPHMLQTLIGATVYHFASGEFGDELLGHPLLSTEEVRRRKEAVKSLLHHGLVA